MTWHIQHGKGYLLCFDFPFGHAKHYLGITDDLPGRLHAHETGNGAKITGYARKAGISWTLTRTWDDCNRARERSLKLTSGTRHCPRCRAEKRMRQDPAYRTFMDRAGATFAQAIAAANADRENAASESAGTRQWNEAVKAAQQELRTAREQAQQEWEARKGKPMTITQQEEQRILPEDATPEEAAELQDTLERGYRKAYEAAREAFNADPWGSDYESRFQTAAEVNEVAGDVVHETLDTGMRRPAESTADFKARAQVEADHERELAQARESGADTAHQMILGWFEHGMPVDEIERRQHDLMTELLGNTKAEAGQAWADAYRDTADTYVRELREMDQAPEVRGPDPDLAPRGWQNCPDHPNCPMMVRRDPDREAGQ